jgi:hypothetical protein
MNEPKESSQEDYSKNGMQTRAWGPPGWMFLHCIAQNYPQEPTPKQKKKYQEFFKLVGDVLPCRYCRESYQQFIKEPSTTLSRTVMKNRTSLSRWLYDIHNKVNKKLEVKEIPTFEEVTEKYEAFRSKCTHKSPVIIEKAVKGCTNPSKEGSLRKKCELVFYDVDERGNKIKPFSFGKRRSSSFGSKKERIKLVSIKRSTKSDKKLMATFETNGRKKVIHFGARGMSDFTKHHDRERRQRYIKRHSKDLGTGNPARAGYLSMFVLWNKSTVSGGIADYRRRLGIYNKTGKFPTKIN